MPEGHLIHHYATTQRQGLLGETTVTSPQGRFGQAAALTGRRLERIEPYRKHLFYWWDADVVHVHLGMQGVFLHDAVPAPEPRRQVRLRIAGPALVVDLIAPLQCDLATPSERDAVVAQLGPDPLRNDADGDRVAAGLRGRRQSIGAALLDQRLVSGIGNVIRAEALHAARLHPRPADSLRPLRSHRLRMPIRPTRRRDRKTNAYPRAVNPRRARRLYPRPLRAAVFVHDVGRVDAPVHRPGSVTSAPRRDAVTGGFPSCALLRMLRP